MKLKHLLAIILFCVSFQGLAQQPKILPQFTFFKLDGKSFTNKDLKTDKDNLLILFDCTCEHCQRELKLLNANYAQFKNTNIYLITLDEAYIIPQFFQTYAKGLNTKPNVTVLQDKNHLFILTFLPSVYPAMYLYSKANKLITYHSGDGSIKKILPAVKK